MAEMYRKNHVEEFFYDDGSVVLFDPVLRLFQLIFRVIIRKCQIKDSMI